MSKLREEFVSWLETKNPLETYEWGDVDNCLIAQFFKHYDMDQKLAYEDDYYHLSCDGRVPYTQPWTFGAALDRAREVYSNPAYGE